MRFPIIDKVPREHLFDDELSWEVPHADVPVHGEPENHYHSSDDAIDEEGKTKSLGDTHL